MDISLQMRAFELVSKFLRHDMDDLPHYGYTVQKPPFPIEKQDGLSTHFERSSPELEGIPSFAIKSLIDSIESNNRKFSVHSLMVMRHGKVISENYWAPYRAHIPHMLYSLSKSFTGTAIGMLEAEGLLSLDEKICDIFADNMPKQSLFFSNPLKDMTVEHLLTMTSGSRFNELGSALDGDWVNKFCESSLKFEPGEEFSYNSLNTYMLAATVVKKSGMSLSEYLRIRLFEPLGIGSYEWEKCPKGIEKGGWGLALTLEDTAKLGQLYLNRGKFNGKQILTEDFIRRATTCAPVTKCEKCRNGYGYQIWIGEKYGSYHFNGAFGQYVIVIPEFDAVVALFCGNTNLFSQSDLLSTVYDLFRHASHTPLLTDGSPLSDLPAQNLPLRVLDSFGTPSASTLRSYECECSASCDGFERLCAITGNKEYRLTKNTASLLPQTLQAVHNNFLKGADMLSFSRNGDSLRVSLYEHTLCNTVTVKKDGSFSYAHTVHKGETHIVGTRGLWSSDGKTLFLLCSFVETPDTRIIKISFEDNGNVKMLFDEVPTIDGATAMLLNLVGLSERAFFKGLMQTDKKSTVSSAIRSFTTPSAAGYEITRNDV